ncbi:hypothetical protein CIG29_27960, partial [Klebsiella pneumoniae]|uniref:hypothetical protein n=1 Tax=Klebsiella pneumoniae TaxID=573 RepID=UPI000BCFF0FC
LERWIKGSAILGCVGCLVGHLFMFLVGGKTPDQSVHLNLTTTITINKTEEEEAKGEARLYFAGSRNQKGGVSIRVKQNLEQMRFIERIMEVL